MVRKRVGLILLLLTLVLGAMAIPTISYGCGGGDLQCSPVRP